MSQGYQAAHRLLHLTGDVIPHSPGLFACWAFRSSKYSSLSSGFSSLVGFQHDCKLQDLPLATYCKLVLCLHSLHSNKYSKHVISTVNTTFLIGHHCKLATITLLPCHHGMTAVQDNIAQKKSRPALQLNTTSKTPKKRGPSAGI